MTGPLALRDLFEFPSWFGKSLSRSGYPCSEIAPVPGLFCVPVLDGENRWEARVGRRATSLPPLREPPGNLSLRSKERWDFQFLFQLETSPGRRA